MSSTLSISVSNELGNAQHSSNAFLLLRGEPRGRGGEVEGRWLVVLVGRLLCNSGCYHVH